MGETERKGETSPAVGRSDGGALSKWIGLGVGAGIGSAAIAAALLYASRTARKKDGADR